jgi:hypothetical protein
MTRTRIAAAALLTALFGAGRAEAETLDIKTGLWETTTTMTMTGMPMNPSMSKEPDYSKMPPEQRERMKQMMKTMRGEPKTTTTRTCITQEQLEKDRFSEHEGNCTRTIVEKTKKVVHMTLTCQSAQGGTGKGEFRYEAPTRETLKGGFEMTTMPAKGGAPIHMKSETTGHWISADCGVVEPD